MPSPLPLPVNPLKALMLPSVLYYQSAEDFQAVMGQPAPAFNPINPPKYWRDTTEPMPNLLTYKVVEILGEPGAMVPKVVALTVSGKYAKSVNFPPSGGQEKLGAEVPFPIRSLLEDEELFLAFGGVVQVRNKTLSGPSPLDRDLMLQEIRAAVFAIKDALGRSGIR